MENDINTLKLIDMASAHLKVHGIESGIVPMPGTDKSIIIGSPAEVVELMPELRGAIPAAWHNFARAIANLPHGAEANIAGMQSKAAQLLAAEGARGKVLPKDEGAVASVGRQLDFRPSEQYSAWFTVNRSKLRNHSIFTKGAVIWNAARAAQPVAASAAALEGLTDTDYQEILRPVLSRLGMNRYLNADPITLDPSDFRKIIDRATQSAKQGAQPSAWISVDERLPERECLAVYVTPSGKQRLIRAKYVRQFQEEASGDEIDQCETECNEDDDTLYLKAGWLECIDNWGEYSSCYVTEGTVTHWQPLPALPGAATQASVEQTPSAQEVTQQAAKAETADRVAIRAWLDAEKASREAIEAYNEAVRESDKYIWPGTDINSEFQIMSQAKNKAFHAMHAMYDALVAPTTSTVSASGALAAADYVWNEAMEAAASLIDPFGEEGTIGWIQANSIRALKRSAAQAATDKSED